MLVTATGDIFISLSLPATAVTMVVTSDKFGERLTQVYNPRILEAEAGGLLMTAF